MENQNSLTSEEGWAEPETATEVAPEATNANYDDYLKAQEAYKSQKIRAEKAEAELKKIKNAPVEKQEKAPEVSLKDQYALLEAKVHPDDLDEVISFAKFKNIPVAEAIKTSVIKNILTERVEQRKTAEVVNTGGTKRGSVKISDEALIDKARQEGLPEKDEDIDRLVKARLQQRLDKRT